MNQHRCKDCHSVLFETDGLLLQTTKIRCRKCKVWNVFEKRFRVGDLIVEIESPSGNRRRILEVRETGYEWEHYDIPGKTFPSEWSNDPFLVWWKEYQPERPEAAKEEQCFVQTAESK